MPARHRERFLDPSRSTDRQETGDGDPSKQNEHLGDVCPDDRRESPHDRIGRRENAYGRDTCVDVDPGDRGERERGQKHHDRHARHLEEHERRAAEETHGEAEAQLQVLVRRTYPQTTIERQVEDDHDRGHHEERHGPERKDPVLRERLGRNGDVGDRR